MTDFASLGIKIDSTQVKGGVADLDKLTAAGERAEAATSGLSSGFRGVGTQAAAMATAAQASARAAMDQAAGFKASASAARINTVAMRETLVVARELSRGNFTRIPGSLTLLAQGIGSQGGLRAFGDALAQTLGLVKTVQNAELAEQAVAAASAAAAVQNAAERAAANIVTADTEVALAEAQLRVTAGTSAEGAAQVRLAEAHQAVAGAAAEAVVAEDALATAMGRSAEARAASAAATTTSVSALGAALGVFSIAAGLALAGVEGFKMEVKDSGELDQFAEGLRLTSSQIEEAGGKVKYLGHNIQEITGLTVTWGDIAKGTFDALAQAAGMSSAEFSGFWKEAFLETAQVGISAAQAIGAAFASVASIVANSKNILVSFFKSPMAGPPDIASQAANAGQQALDKFTKTFGDIGKFFHETLPNSINAEAQKRLQGLSDRNNPPKPPKPKKPKRDEAADEIAKLDAQIKGENELTQAYLTSDAAVIKAEADQKAMVLAVEKHATAAQAAALKDRELALALATINKTGAEAVNSLTFEAESRKRVNDMVAAGIIPASQANAQLQLEDKLRPLVAAASLEEGKAKEKTLGIIKALTQAYADNNAQLSRQKALQEEAANDNEIARLNKEASLIGASNRERAIALAQLDAMQKLVDMPGLSPQEQANFVQSEIDKATAGLRTPFQEWAASVPQTADAINEALQSIETRGIDSLASAITDVVTGTKSLKDAFSDLARSIISDLVQMTVKMLIFRALSSAFPGLFGSGGGNPAVAIGAAGANGLVLSGGSVVPFALGGVVSGPTLFGMSGGRAGLMGEAGPEAVMPLARDGQGRLGVRANDNQNGPIEIVIGFGEAPDFAPYVQKVSAAHSAAAVRVSTDYTNKTLRKVSRPKMMGQS